MSGLAVVGAQWGDEGKGKIVDLLARQVDLVVRYQGGNNAGHTLVVDGEKLIMHLIPSGMLQKNVVCAISDAVVINPTVLLDEIHTLRDLGHTVTPARLKLSPSAHVIMPYHVDFDVWREKMRGQESIGTTGRGIGPCYEDKAAREGIRLGEFVTEPVFAEKLRKVLIYKNLLAERVFQQKPFSYDEIFAKYLKLAKELKPFVEQPTPLIQRTLAEKGKRVMFEGAQGVMLDIDRGTYPYVTSSNTVAGAIAPSSGIGPQHVPPVLGVCKAYLTRVGGGPFPSEIAGASGDLLRKKGGEYGATTGRPRRCGHLDLVLLRYAVAVSGLQMLALTKLDVLSGFSPLKVVNHYTIAGKKIKILDDMAQLEKAEAVAEEHPGFSFDPDKIKTFSDLPQQAQDYVRFIEMEVGIPVALIGLGQGREQTLTLQDPFTF